MLIIDENYRMSLKYLTAVILLCHALVVEVVGSRRPKGNICENGYSCDGKSNKCYFEKDRCNGKSTCFNNADEKNCTAAQCNSHYGLFLCTSGRCIYETWMCDKTDDCEDNSDEQDCSGSTTRVIISAVVGSLICSLLLVVVLGCTCKQYLLSTRDTCRRTRHSTPLSRLQVEIMGRRPPPPSYNEAMLTSRPFEEVRREVISRQSTSPGESNPGYESDVMNDGSTFDLTSTARSDNVETEAESRRRAVFESNSESETSGCDNTNDLTDDDELLDLGEDSDVHIQMNEEEDDDVNLLAVWHSNFGLPSSDQPSDDTQLLDLSNKTSKDCDKNKLTPPVTSSTSSPSSTSSSSSSSSASSSSTYAQSNPPPLYSSSNHSPLPSNNSNTSLNVTSLQSQFSDCVPLLEDV